MSVLTPVRLHCFISLKRLTYNERIISLSPSFQFLNYCIIVDSVCLHGPRAALRKAYFVHITVSLRHGKAYGKYSHKYPVLCIPWRVWLWLCVSAVISVCFRVCGSEHEHLCSCTFREITWLSGIFQWTCRLQNMSNKQKAPRSLSVLYRAATPPPLHSILVSSLTGSVTQKCLYWGCLILSSCRGKQMAHHGRGAELQSHRQKWKLKGELRWLWT